MKQPSPPPFRRVRRIAMRALSPALLAGGLALLALTGACGREELEGPGLVGTANGHVEIRGSDWIRLSSTYHEFGKIWHGDKPSHTFWVRNRAEQSIRLVGLRSACSCAYEKLEIVGADGEPVAREIHQPAIQRDGAPLITWLEPGETLTVQVHVESMTLPSRDHRELGKTELYFQPAEAGTVTFAYDIDIRSRVRIHPGPQVSLEPASKFQKNPVLLELSPGENMPPFEIEKIVGTDENFRLEQLEPTQEHGHRFLLEVGPIRQIGPIERQIAFHTNLTGGDLEEPYVARVLVLGTIVPTLRFTPAPRLDFGRIRFDVPGRSFVTVSYLRPGVDPGLELGELVVQGQDAEDLSQYFEKKLERDLDDTWTIRLDYLGGLEKTKHRRFQGQLRLRSKDPDHKSTWIPFTGFARTTE